MRKIRISVHTGFAGCKHEDVIEVDDDTTEEEINEMATDFMHNYIELSWKEITDDHED